MAQVRKALPANFYDHPLVRSYACADAGGNLYRVEVRGPHGGPYIQATFPMPSRCRVSAERARTTRCNY